MACNRLRKILVKKKQFDSFLNYRSPVFVKRCFTRMIITFSIISFFRSCMTSNMIYKDFLWQFSWIFLFLVYNSSYKNDSLVVSLMYMNGFRYLCCKKVANLTFDSNKNDLHFLFTLFWMLKRSILHCWPMHLNERSGKCVFIIIVYLIINNLFLNVDASLLAMFPTLLMRSYITKLSNLHFKSSKIWVFFAYFYPRSTSFKMFEKHASCEWRQFYKHCVELKA